MYTYLDMTQFFTEEEKGLDSSPFSGKATSGEK